MNLKQGQQKSETGLHGKGCAYIAGIGRFTHRGAELGAIGGGCETPHEAPARNECPADAICQNGRRHVNFDYFFSFSIISSTSS